MSTHIALSTLALLAFVPDWAASFNPDLGTIPDWIGGVGTAAAFGIGLALFGRELKEFRATEEDRRRAQATQISAWCKAADAGQGQPSRCLLLRNGSGEPAYQCAVLFASANHQTWTARDHGEWQAAISKTAARYGARGTMVLTPGETVSWKVNGEELQAAEEEIAPVFLIFRDAQGRLWSRSPRGELRRFNSPVLDDEEMVDLMSRSERQ